MSLVDNLSQAGKDLYQKIADMFGAGNVIVTSGKRNRNDKSQHNVGDAFDFKVRGLSNSEVFQRIQNSGLEYRQLIDEISGPASSGPHIHIGAGSGNQNMIYKDGKYVNVGKSTPAYEQSGWTEGTIEQWLNKKIWGIEPGTNVIGNSIGRIIAIIIGVIFIGLAIAAFVFKNETAKEIVSAALPSKG